MLVLASVLLSVAAVAFWSLAKRSRIVLGCGAGVLGLAACIRSWGVAEGLLVQLTLSMTAASMLVLILAPRRSWAEPLAVVSSVAGVAASAWGLLS